MTDLLWTTASADIEAEEAALRMSRAKVAVAGLWPFLALAKSEREFDHRVALTSQAILDRVQADLFDPIVASLREDFLLVAADESDDGDSDDGGDDGDSSMPDWLDKKVHGARQVTAEYFDQGQGAWVKLAVDDDATRGKGNPWYFTGGDEAGPATGETNQFPTFPVGNPGDPVDPLNQMFPMEPSPWVVPPDKAWRENPMQFNSASRHPFHVAQVGDGATCSTCNKPIKHASGEGGKSWAHSGFKQAWLMDDDHIPTPKKTGSLKQAGEGIVPTPGPNPNYFAAGSEGVAGDASGFPPDVTVPDDSDDWMVNSYGATPPAKPVGVVSTGAQFYHQGQRRWITMTAADQSDTEGTGAPDSDPDLGTELASPQEAERYRRARNGEEPGYQGSFASLHTGGEHKQGAYVGNPSTTYDPKYPNKNRSFLQRENWSQVGRKHFMLTDEDSHVGGAVNHARGGWSWNAHSMHPNCSAHNSGWVPDATTAVDHVQNAADTISQHLHDEPHEPGKPCSMDPLHGLASRNAFYDPNDRGVRMLAADDPTSATTTDPYGADNPYSSGADAGAASTDTASVAPPPSMTPGGAGSQPQPPLQTGMPMTTSPRQMPGGGGGDSNVPPPDPSQSRAAVRHQGESRDRPTVDNPYGTADPFDAKTWDAVNTQRPQQPMEQMNVNGPQNPRARAPIRTTTSPGAQQGEEDDEEED